MQKIRNQSFIKVYGLWLRNYISGVLLIFATIWPISASAQAVESIMPGFKILTALNGCKIFETERIIKSWEYGNPKIDWTGSCVGGFAQGKGDIVLKYSTHVITVTLRANAGYPVGWSKQHSVYNGKTTDFYIFRYGDQSIGFTPDSLGLVIDESLIFSDAVPLPKLTNAITGSAGDMFSTIARNSVTLMRVGCAFARETMEQFKNCTYDPGSNDEVYIFISKSNEPVYPWKDAVWNTCPNPQVFDSACAALIYQLTTPMRKEVIGFVETSRPSVEAILQRMSSAK